jgi:hypothetical protein
MVAYIDEDALASYLQTTITGGEADLVIELANGLVTDVVGDLEPVPTLVRAVALEAAARAWRNPQGYSSVTSEIDDYTKTVRREGAALTAAGVYLTDAEEARLLRLVGVRKAGTITLDVPLGTFDGLEQEVSGSGWY